MDRTRNCEHRERRFKIQADGRVRAGSGKRRMVVMENLSEGGCCYYAPGTIFDPGDEVMIRIGEVGPFEAIVRWSRSGQVGVQFEKAFYPPTFDYLRDRFAVR